MKKKILIIGGTGFIGYHLASKCLEKKWAVSSFSTKKPSKKRILKKVNYIICDISNKKLLKKKINSNFDYVVNLGGYVDHTNKSKTLKTHYNGCKNIAEIFLKKNILSFVQIGSSLEYGKLKSPHSESSRCTPKSYYAKAKYQATRFLVKLYKNKKFPVAILRLYQVYGPNQDFNRFIPIIINGCLKNNKFPCSEGKQLRDFTYVSDVVEAIIKALITKKSNGKIFNIGRGQGTEIKQVIKKIHKFIKKGKPQFGKIKLRVEENLKTFPNINKAQKILNWKPKISFKLGLSKTIRHYEKTKI